VIFHPNGCVSFSGVDTTVLLNIFSVQDSLDVGNFLRKIMEKHFLEPKRINKKRRSDKVKAQQSAASKDK